MLIVSWIFVFSKNVKICLWCEGQVHAKCLKGELGCLTCFENMYPVPWLQCIHVRVICYMELEIIEMVAYTTHTDHHILLCN